jgi:hypothetical protein
MKHIFIFVFILIALALMLLNLMPVLQPEWAKEANVTQISFSFSIAGFVAFIFHLISILGVTAEKAKGVVHNPAPVKDRDSKAPCPSGECSEDEVCVIQITEPLDSGLKEGDLILYHNKAKRKLCDGEKLDIVVKGDKIASVAGIGGARISYGKKP